MTSDFNSAVEISKTRAAMNLRLGEIISAVIGDDRIKALFDHAGKHPDEYAGQATGEMALKLNILTPDTKTALLVAQAAERAYKLAEKAESYAQNNKNLVAYYKKKNADASKEKTLFIDEKSVGVVGYDDPVFKFVGSEKDPELLKAAQGTWMTAQIYLNNEINIINGDAQVPSGRARSWPGMPYTMGPQYADGFKKAAGGFYLQAAQMLAKEGHAAAAKRFEAAGKAIMKGGLENKTAPTPWQFLNDHLSREQRDIEADNRPMGELVPEERWSLNKKYEETLQKLIKLTTPPPSATAKTALKP